MDTVLDARIEALCEEGRDLFHDFDTDVRQDHWHPFVAADYACVREALLPLRRPGARFLEWGSATGVITIMADMMGFDACGIELDASLVTVARNLAERSGSRARFASGSFIPLGWEWKPRDGDGRVGTLGQGPSGYLALGKSLSDFDVVYGFPWMGEQPLMLALMAEHGDRDARLVIHSPEDGVKIYRDGKRES